MSTAYFAKQLWDVAIVGAGPAGATAAIHLAGHGHRVLLLDHHDFPRDKVCGDALIPDAINCAKRAGLYEEILEAGHPLSVASVYSPSRIQFDVPSHYVTIKRLVLDDLIVRKAIATGAEFCRADVTSVDAQTGGDALLIATGSEEPIRSRIVFLATGATVGLAARLGLVERMRPSAIAMRCYVKSRYHLDRLIIAYDHTTVPGYAWIFPLRDGEYNVGCGVKDLSDSDRKINLRQTLDLFLKDFPVAIELMKQADRVTPLRGAMLRCGLNGSRPLGGNVLVLGETIGATFPFTGEGIGKAMETGEVAAECAHEALSSSDLTRLEKYRERLERELKPKFLAYQIAEDWLSRPWLNDLVARRIRRSRFLQESLVGIVNETVDPPTVFSLGGLVKSLFR